MKIESVIAYVEREFHLCDRWFDLNRFNTAWPVLPDQRSLVDHFLTHTSYVVRVFKVGRLCWLFRESIGC